MHEPAPLSHDELASLRLACRDLRERVGRYEALIELSADWFWQQDEHLRLVNLGVATQWPSDLPSMGSMLGRTYWEVPGFDMPGGWQAHQERLARREAYRDVEVRYTRPDGAQAIFCLSGTPTFDSAGAFTGYIGVGRDVTESRRAQQDLRESQRAMSALIANLPGMALRGANEPDRPLSFASDGAWALTGYSAADLLRGQPRYGDLIHPDDKAMVWDTVQAALAQRRQFHLTYRLNTRQGLRWVWEQGSGAYGPGGEVLALEGFVTDVTESKLAQEEVARLNASLEHRVRDRTSQLEAAHAELQAFAHAIAHDLRAPLTTIAGFSQLLERSLPSSADANQTRWLHRMAAGVQQMGVLTDALLALASLSSATLQDEEVDLAQLARGVVARLRRAEPDREADVDIPEHLWVRGDPRLLAQVVTHLIDNAWKFSRRKPQTVIRMGSMPLDGDTAYYVADEGAGFDMAHAWRLFTGFQRLHTPAEFDGAGVGLALSHRIIARHGGRIWVQAAPDDGATFYFTLPATLSPADPPGRA
jgi:signal transduction histidine kinase